MRYCTHRRPKRVVLRISRAEALCRADESLTVLAGCLQDDEHLVLGVGVA